MVDNHQVEIRQVVLADTPSIHLLCQQLGWHISKDETKERLEYILANPSHYGFFIAEVDDKVMGFGNAILKMEMNSGPQARIDGVVVDANCRGLGLGRLLMEATEKWAREHGSKTMKLVSNAKRIESHKFYAKIGYENTKTQLAFKKKL